MSDNWNAEPVLVQALARIDALEMRVTFLDELSDSLDQMVTQQTQQLLDIHAQMQILYQRLEASKQQEHDIEPFNVLGDRPPHY